MTFSMYDSVTLSEIPSSARAVAGYVGGNFPTFSNLAAEFPNARHLSIAVNAGEDAECLDIESGDATPSEAPAWYRRQVARGVQRPCFYANTSTMPSVIAALSGAGIRSNEYRLWTAHYTHVAHIETGSGATQWTDRSMGRNLDESMCVSDFLTDKPPVAPIVNTVHYDWFDNQPRMILGLRRRERGQVELYDKLRALQTSKLHPRRVQLAFVRRVLRSYAGRVYTVATSGQGKPSWSVDHRGWRYQQLIHRAQGQRFV